MYTILVVDDEKDIVSALEIYLKAEGYRVLSACNGKEALAAAAREDVHLILMDIMMPVMDGLSAMAQLRQTSNVPVILLTAKGEDTDKVLGLNVGADDYITKPFNPVELLARVRSQLRRSLQLGGGQVQASTLIIGGKGKQEAIEKRCEAIRNELKNPHSDYELDVMRERLAKLSGGIAVMSVGAATETEMNEIRSRIQDALRATRSAASQGLLAGGGVALIQASKALDQVEAANEEERFGVDILRKALEEPMRALCSNAGYNGDVEVAKALEAQPGFGLDCETGKYGDMISMGVADPAKVTVTALQAAASVASLILITNCSITEADKKDEEEK